MQQQTNRLTQAQTTFGAKPGGVTAALKQAYVAYWRHKVVLTGLK